MNNNQKALATTAAQVPGRPIVNYFLNGCNIQQGTGTQIIAGGPSQADTIRTQAEIIAAQQRTIDRLITMLERQTIAQH